LLPKVQWLLLSFTHYFKKVLYILGISAWYHDSGACLIKDGLIIAAVQEERFTRLKHDSVFPCNSISYCLTEANIGPSSIDSIVFYEKPFLKFERLLETYLAFAPRGFKSFSKSMPLWIKNKLYQRRNICKELENLWGKEEQVSERLLFSEHHMSHAASAFFPSPFKRAAVLTLDGVGEWTTSSVAVGNGSNLNIVKEIHFPHSLGLLYSAFTYYLGFKVNSGEYKVMGLAPYGEPKYLKLIKEKLIDIRDDGSFQLDMSYFDYSTGLKMTNNKFNKLFGASPRMPESELTQRDMDIAASIQKLTEEVLVKISRTIAQETGEKNLCLAGGVALNCVANGVLLKEKIFENIWVQPAAGDAGGALGAAFAAYHLHKKMPRIESNNHDSMKGSYLGPEFSSQDIKLSLDKIGAVYHENSEYEMIEITASALTREKAIGWMQGRMEFGPRALGGRSIIADPRSNTMQKQLNLKVKYRESFRPFAPSILAEYVGDWFEHKDESPYMLFVANLVQEKRFEMTQKQKKLFGIEKLNIPRSSVPAITHVDYSSRIQTVNGINNPLFYKILKKFHELTGCPMLVNTSFNVRGEPIVCSPTDAFRCFMGTELDMLIIGNYILYKEEQNQDLKENYQDCYELD